MKVNQRRNAVKYLIGGAALIGMSRRAWTGESRRTLIAETASGKVRGLETGEVISFKGIPYGAPTGCHRRFMAPERPAPWPGVRDALEIGPRSPQLSLEQLEKDYEATLPEAVRGRFTAEMEAVDSLTRPYGELHPRQSEDCLVLNLWTPALDGGRRPVMVWLHGGGFEQGSGGAPWFDGSHLAGRENVAVVTVNHRLNILGYLYLNNRGDGKYTNSANAGMLDLVESLKWIRENISTFGGNPNNVTIVGHSGGGIKVTTLMSMPVASGLFHKAIVQSGSFIGLGSRDEAIACADVVFESLNLGSDQANLLQTVPLDKLYAAVPRGLLAKFQPVADGNLIPSNPFVQSAPAISANVPMLIGNTKDEDAAMIHPEGDLDENALVIEVRKLIGSDESTANAAISAYRKTRPNITQREILRSIHVGYMFRKPAIRQAELKLGQGGAATFMYEFRWVIPAFGRKYGAPHCVEVPFVFDNLDKAPAFGIPPADANSATLARNVSRAWAQFARTGNPGHPGLPEWEPYTMGSRATMILDSRSTIVQDPNRDERLALQGLRAAWPIK
jgi:para-nitrobenzyl esterase